MSVPELESFVDGYFKDIERHIREDDFTVVLFFELLT